MDAGKWKVTARGNLEKCGAVHFGEYTPNGIDLYRCLFADITTSGLPTPMKRGLFSVIGMGCCVVYPVMEPHELIRGLKCSQEDARLLLELINHLFAGDGVETYELRDDRGIWIGGNMTLEEAKSCAVNMLTMGLTVRIIGEQSAREIVA